MNNKLIIVTIITVLVAMVSVSLYFLGKTKTANNKTYKVGILSGSDIFIPIVDGFVKGMDKLGYVQGGNIFYDVQKVNADHSAFKQIVEKFVDDKVDLIFALPTEPAIVAKAVAKDANIPIVFVGDIEGTDIVESVSHPGENITGVRISGPQSAAKRLELVHEILPQAKRIYLPYDKNYPITSATLELVRSVAKALNLNLVELPAESQEDIIADLERRDRLPDIGIDDIVITPNPLVTMPLSWQAITTFAQKHDLLISGTLVNQINNGAAFVLTSDFESMGEAAASIADKILFGIPAGSLPLETPTLHLRVNYSQAKNAGIELSESFLLKVDEIVR